MENHPSNAAPDAQRVLKSVASLVWHSKSLIGGATIVAAAIAFALVPINMVESWSGRATLRIGLAPASEYIMLHISPPLVPIDTPRGTVAQLSEPNFRQQVVSHAAFEPATAAHSRSMVVSSMRGIPLDDERDIAIELNAASAADVQTAFRAVAAEIVKMHDAILNRRLELLQDGINNSKRRIATIEKASNQFNDRIFSAVPDDKTISRIFAAIPAAAIPKWSDLQDRIEQDENVKKMSEPTVLRLESDNYGTGPRSVRRLQFSMLAGLGMLIAMIALTVVFSRPQRSSAN